MFHQEVGYKTVHIICALSFALGLGANDATRAKNKQYTLQKSCFCPFNFFPSVCIWIPLAPAKSKGVRVF